MRSLKLDLDEKFSSRLCFLSLLLTTKGTVIWGLDGLQMFYPKLFLGFFGKSLFSFAPLTQSKKSVAFREKPDKTGCS